MCKLYRGSLRYFTAAIGIILSISAQPASLAFDLTANALSSMEASYKKYCELNVKELVDLLRTQKTIIQGSTVLAYESVAKCDYEYDFMLKSLQNPELLRRTEIAVNSLGPKVYVKRAYADLSSARRKYMIDSLEELLRSNLGLSEDEIDTLTAFSKVRARSEARIDFAKSLAN